jgi:hypothetical protein
MYLKIFFCILCCFHIQTVSFVEDIYISFAVICGIFNSFMYVFINFLFSSFGMYFETNNSYSILSNIIYYKKNIF